MRHTVWARSLLIVNLCLCGSAIALAQAPSSIQVFMPSGGLPDGVLRLTLVRDDGFIDRVFTDSKGKFEIATPRGQSVSYTVTIESDGQTFETTTVAFSLDRNSPNNFTIFLKPLRAKKLPSDAVLDVTNFEGNIPSKASAAYKRAMLRIKDSQLEDAIFDLQEAIKLYPQYVRAYNDLGVLFLKLERLDEAAATFRSAIEISKRFFHPRMNLGLVLNRQGKFKEAIETLATLYKENHGMLEVRLAYADALVGAGEFTEAERVYRTTLDSSKSLPEETKATLQYKLGFSLSRQGKFPEAVVELDRAVMLNPRAANSHLQLGGALMQVEQPARAEKELLRAYELAGPLAGGAQLLLGHIYYSQKRYADAQRAFEQYLKDVPKAPNAMQITQLLADLKASLKN